MKYVFLVIAIFCMPALAQNKVIEGIGIHLVSRHDPNHGENQTNPGIFIRFQDGIVAGTYTNSLSRDTKYVGWATPEWHRLRLSVLAATGYTRKGVVVVPIPSVKLYEFDKGMQVWLSGVPFQVADSRAVGHIHVEWKMK